MYGAILSISENPFAFLDPPLLVRYCSRIIIEYCSPTPNPKLYKFSCFASLLKPILFSFFVSLFVLVLKPGLFSLFSFFFFFRSFFLSAKSVSGPFLRCLQLIKLLPLLCVMFSASCFLIHG